MKTLKVRPQLLEETINNISLGLNRPLFRGLGKEALTEYLFTGCQTPRSGSLSTGTAVCFSADPTHALSYMTTPNGILLVTDQHLLAGSQTVIDTRIPGYLDQARERMDKSQGIYNGYELWAELQRDDSILYERKGYTYASRKKILQKHLLYEIIIEKEEL